MRAIKPSEWLVGFRPRLQVSAAVGSASAGRAKDLAIPHRRSGDEGTNYIPWRLMELLTHLYEVHMDSVVLATGPRLDKTLLSWSAFSAGFFAMSTTLPDQQSFHVREIPPLEGP